MNDCDDANFWEDPTFLCALESTVAQYDRAPSGQQLRPVPFNTQVSSNFDQSASNVTGPANRGVQTPWQHVSCRNPPSRVEEVGPRESVNSGSAPHCFLQHTATNETIRADTGIWKPQAPVQSFNGEHQGRNQPASEHQGRPPSRPGGLESCKASSSKQHLVPQQGAQAAASVTVRLRLGTDGKVEAHMPRNELLRKALERAEGVVFNPQLMCWEFAAGRRREVMGMLQGLAGLRVVLDDLDPLVQAVLQAAAALPDARERYSRIPGHLEAQLMPFQRLGVQFALRRGGRALIGDETGLGKTVQAIAIISCFREEWPVLIITPTLLKHQWAEALHKWLGVTEEQIHVVNNSKDDGRLEGRSFRFLIISYTFVSKLKDQLQARKYKVVVCDEAHSIKDYKAQRTKDTVPLLKAAERALLLTGTPALGRPKELFQLITAALPRAPLTMHDFGERYCQGPQVNNRFPGQQYQGASNQEELHRLLTASIMVRRLKCDVLKQLPAKRRQQIMLSLAPAKEAELKKHRGKLEGQRAVQEEGGGGRMEHNVLLNEFYTLTAQLKVDAVTQYLQEMLQNDQKFIIFAHHKCMMEGIERALNAGKVRYIVIDGQTDPRVRSDLVQQFEEQAQCRAALLSIKAAGCGLTLTAASVVVFAELTWSPGDIVQAEDRAHRIGQASAVNIYFLHACGSIDDLIWRSIQTKLDNVGQVLNGESEALHMAVSSRLMLPAGQSTLQSFLLPRPPPPAPTPAGTAASGPGGLNCKPSASHGGVGGPPTWPRGPPSSASCGPSSVPAGRTASPVWSGHGPQETRGSTPDARQLASPGALSDGPQAVHGSTSYGNLHVGASGWGRTSLQGAEDCEAAGQPWKRSRFAV